MTSILKDPDASLDYAWSWVDWLADGETITGQVITLPDGISLASGRPAPAIVGGTVVAWLSGGVDGSVYDIPCHITTSAGRQDDRTLRLRCVQR